MIKTQIRKNPGCGRPRSPDRFWQDLALAALAGGKDSAHGSGRFAWIMGDFVQRFHNPIPWRGSQGLFDVPETALHGGFDAA